MKKLMLFLAIVNIYSCASYQKTAKYYYKFEEAKKLSDIAMKKIKYNLKIETNLTNDKEAVLYYQKYKYIDLKFKPSNKNTIIQMTSYNERVPYFIDDIIMQELKNDYGEKQLKHKKSFILAFLLSCISPPAIGDPYIKYKNPYYSKNEYFNDILGGLLVEAIGIWALGTDFGISKFNFRNSMKWRWLPPIVSLIFSPYIYLKINEYNNLVQSGYSFKF